MEDKKTDILKWICVGWVIGDIIFGLVRLMIS